MKQKKAFTLIELLVVIAIIGVIATISIIALQNARAKSRDAKRVGDAKQIQTALELFFNDNNRYPTAEEFALGSIFSTSSGATSTYMQIIPSAPTPADGSCTSGENTIYYQQTDDGNSYTISFCLGNTTGTLTSGPKCLTPAGIVDVDCSAPGPVALPDPCQTETCSWQTVGSAGFSPNGAYGSNIYVHNNVPYVAFIDSVSSKISAMTYNGSSWSNVGSPSFTAGMSWYPNLNYYNGQLYVAYSDNAYSGGTVMTFDGSSWSNLGLPPFSSGAGNALFNTTRVYGSTIYVAFSDGGDNNKSYVAKYDGSSWSILGGGAISAGYAEYTVLDLDDNGIPYVAFSDSTCGSARLSVKKYEGSSWVYVGSPCVTPLYAWWPAIAVDGSDVYVSYGDANDGQKAHVKKYDGSSWSDISGSLSVGQANYHSLRFYNGNLYASYQDSGVSSAIFVKKYDGLSWETLGGSQASVSGTLQGNMFLEDGIIYIAYADTANGYRETVRKFAP